MDKKQTWNLGYWVIAFVLLLLLERETLDEAAIRALTGDLKRMDSTC